MLLMLVLDFRFKIYLDLLLLSFTDRHRKFTYSRIATSRLLATPGYGEEEL